MPDIVQRENRWRTSDGVDLYCKSWFPEKNNPNPRAVVVYTHGIESHTGWFEETGLHLAEHGHPVVSVDRRGCGRSGGPKGHMDSYNQVVEDLRGLVLDQKRLWPHRPVIGIGLSLGGLFMTALAMKHHGLLQGVVNLVPAVGTRLSFPPSAVARMIIASVLTPQKQYPIPIRTTMFTTNPEALRFIESDPLRMKEASARFYWSLLRMRNWVRRNPERMKTPLLTLLAENEEIIDNDAVREWLGRIPAEPSRTVEYSGVKHSILFEPCRDQVLEEIESFATQIEEQ